MSAAPFPLEKEYPSSAELVNAKEQKYAKMAKSDLVLNNEEAPTDTTYIVSFNNHLKPSSQKNCSQSQRVTNS